MPGRRPGAHLFCATLCTATAFCVCVGLPVRAARTTRAPFHQYGTGAWDAWGSAAPSLAGIKTPPSVALHISDSVPLITRAHAQPFPLAALLLRLWTRQLPRHLHATQTWACLGQQPCAPATFMGPGFIHDTMTSFAHHTPRLPCRALATPPTTTTASTFPSTKTARSKHVCTLPPFHMLQHEDHRSCNILWTPCACLRCRACTPARQPWFCRTPHRAIPARATRCRGRYHALPGGAPTATHPPHPHYLPYAHLRCATRVSAAPLPRAASRRRRALRHLTPCRACAPHSGGFSCYACLATPRAAGTPFSAVYGFALLALDIFSLLAPTRHCSLAFHPTRLPAAGLLHPPPPPHPPRVWTSAKHRVGRAGQWWILSGRFGQLAGAHGQPYLTP